MQDIDEALEVLKRNATEPTAWETFAFAVYEPLLAYVGSLLLTFRVGSVESAEDIVQEGLVRFYVQRKKGNISLTSAESTLAYLRKTCRNLVIDRYRHEKHATQLLNFLEYKFNHAFGAERDIYQSLFVSEIIQSLPPSCADLFSQYVTEDLSLAEIADRLRMDPGKFYPKWYRCLERAKEIFLRKGTPNRS